jgi:hypothetical protein
MRHGACAPIDAGSDTENEADADLLQRLLERTLSAPHMALEITKDLSWPTAVPTSLPGVVQLPLSALLHYGLPAALVRQWPQRRSDLVHATRGRPATAFGASAPRPGRPALRAQLPRSSSPPSQRRPRGPPLAAQRAASASPRGWRTWYQAYVDRFYKASNTDDSGLVTTGERNTGVVFRSSAARPLAHEAYAARSHSASPWDRQDGNYTVLDTWPPHGPGSTGANLLASLCDAERRHPGSAIRLSAASLLTQNCLACTAAAACVVRMPPSFRVGSRMS